MKRIIAFFVMILSCLLVACNIEDQVQDPAQPLNLQNDKAIEVAQHTERAVKEYTFDFPKDYSFEPYSEPTFTSYEDFEWGEYMPFVIYTKYGFDECVPSFALLGEGVSSLEQGHRVYEKINDLYLTKYPIPEGDLFGIPFSDEWVSDWFFSSNIVYMSQDLDQIQTWRIVDFMENTRHGELDNWENGKLTNTKAYDTYYYPNTRSKIESELIKPDGIKAERSFDIDSHNNQSVKMYDNGELYCEIKFNFCDEFTKTIGLEQIIDRNRLLITIIHHGEFANWPEDNGINRNTYLIDIEKGEMVKIENYMFCPLLSPDGEYLIYSSCHDSNASANPVDNYAYIMQEGFYVKRISTGSTVFYPFPDSWNTTHDALCWIDKESYFNLINNR